MTIFEESAESATEFVGKNNLPANDKSLPMMTRLLKEASPFNVDVPSTYKREFSEMSPLAKSRPFRLRSSDTMS